MKKIFKKVFKSWLYIAIYFSLLIVNVLLYWYFLFRSLTVFGIIMIIILSFFTSFFLLLFVEKRKVLFVVIVAVLSIYLPYRSLGNDFLNFQLNARSSLTSYTEGYPLGPQASSSANGVFQYSYFQYAHDAAYCGLIYFNDYDSTLYSVNSKNNVVTKLPIDTTNKTYEFGYSYGMIYLVITDSTKPGYEEFKIYYANDLTQLSSDQTLAGDFKFFFSNDYTIIYDMNTGKLYDLNRHLIATRLHTFDGSNGSYDLTSVNNIDSISMYNDQFIVTTDSQVYVFASDFAFEKNITYSYTDYVSLQSMNINGKFAIVYNMGEGNYNIDYFNNYLMLENQVTYQFPVDTKMLYASSAVYDYFCFRNNMYIYNNYDAKYPIAVENTYPNILATYAFSDNNGQYRIMQVPGANGNTELYMINLESFRYNNLADAAFYGKDDPADSFKGMFTWSVILEVIYIAVLLTSQYLVIKYINPNKDMSTKEYFKKYYHTK